MSKVTLVKMIVLIVALTNNSLALAGKSPLPFNDVEVENFISTVITIVASLIAWKHQNFKKEEK